MNTTHTTTRTDVATGDLVLINGKLYEVGAPRNSIGSRILTAADGTSVMSTQAFIGDELTHKVLRLSSRGSRGSLYQVRDSRNGGNVLITYTSNER